jgi:O-succinylbenzoate synthase
VALQVDANASYTLAHANHLAKLDEFDLLLLEQPLAAGDLKRHADLAKRLRTPVCLDESIKSAVDAADAIALGACSIINIKAGRVGGYLESRRIHDLCFASDVPTWCGGMLESGVGRAANLALAALPGCTLPGDVSASSRFWHEDITTPFVLEDGFMRVPDGPGIGVTPLPERVQATVIDREWLPADCGR